MNAAANLTLAAVVFGPGVAIAVPVLLSQRGAKTDSARVQAVLAASAAERATAEQDRDQPTPPPAREPAPVERLAPVIDLTTRRAA